MSRIFTFVNELPFIVSFLVTIVFVVIYGLVARKLYKKKTWKIIAIIVLMLWFIALVWTTINSRDCWTRKIDIVPFSNLIKLNNIHGIVKGYILNAILFVPLGMTAPFIINNYVKRPVLETILYGFIISLIIEITQYIFAVGYSEMEDLIMNTAGTAIGTISYLIANYERKNSKV